jgi:hypothetical protein
MCATRAIRDVFQALINTLSPLFAPTQNVSVHGTAVIAAIYALGLGRKARLSTTQRSNAAPAGTGSGRKARLSTTQRSNAAPAGTGSGVRRGRPSGAGYFAMR